jgi:hypothetical protein
VILSTRTGSLATECPDLREPPGLAPSSRWRARKKGDHQKSRELRRKQARLPSVDCDDSGYRRLHYARYADDTLFGFTGPRAEAEEIKERLTAFLRNELRLELSAEKTLITHARTGAAKFLGYEITTQHSGTSGRKTINGSVALRVPIPVIKAKCSPYLARGKPAAQTALHNRGDYDIVAVLAQPPGPAAVIAAAPRRASR